MLTGRHLICAVSLAVLGSSPAALAAPGEAALQGASALVAGEIGLARVSFARAAQMDAHDGVAVVGRGAAELLAGNPAEARKLFGEAQMLAPQLVCARIGAGTAACQVGDFQAAMEHYHSALICGPERPSGALAGEAYAACALGLYDTAIRQARAALGTDPEHPLAAYALAAACLARGDGGPAGAMARRNPRVPSVPCPTFLPSCLLAPGTAYYQSRLGGDHARLGSIGLGGVAPAAPGTGRESEGTDDFSLSRPVHGCTVEDRMVAEVSATDRLDLAYVIVRVNDTFAGISSAKPFKIIVNTRLFGDGLANIRADGHDGSGNRVRTASCVVHIQNASYSLAPAEREARRAVGEMLEELLLPPIAPAAYGQLAGHGLLRSGYPDHAVVAFENAYARDASVPGLRSDLLVAYSELGITPRQEAPEIYTVPGNGRKVALTFDDGPHPMITPWILDLLDTERVKATFFLVGKQATLYPELVRDIRDRGHQIGSHSYAHYSMRNLAASECEQDLVKSRLALRAACGETVTLFRPPGGYYDDLVKHSVGNLGFHTVFWTANITSFPGRDGGRIAAELARQCSEGGIVLLHNGEDETLDTLPHLIPALRSQGLKFVTIEDPRAGTMPGARATARGG